MRHLQRGLVASLFLLAAFGAAPAAAQTPPGCMPLTGTFTGVQYYSLLNAALARLINTNRGSVAPVTDCSGTTVQGQQWFDTSLATPAWRMWDGAQGVGIGYFDTVSHIWMPVIGGGINSLASAATVDLCGSGGTLVPQNYLSIAGSVAISSFGTNCQTGQIKFVAFSAITVITYNTSAIITPTGHNITTTPGDVAQLIYLGGGVWSIVSYQTVGGGVPTGTVIATAGSTPDPGYLLANGQCVSQTLYPALNVRIGSYASCPVGQFGLPDLRGRVIAAPDAGVGRLTIFSASLGANGGAQNNVVQQGNLANFALPVTVNDPGHAHGYTVWNTGQFSGTASGAQTPQALVFQGNLTTTTAFTNIGVSVNSGGSNSPFPTVQPTLILNYEIKY